MCRVCLRSMGVFDQILGPQTQDPASQNRSAYGGCLPFSKRARSDLDDLAQVPVDKHHVQGRHQRIGRWSTSSTDGVGRGNEYMANVPVFHYRGGIILLQSGHNGWLSPQHPDGKSCCIS